MRLKEKIKTGVYTIAEMSANHAGDLDNALAIVDAAKDAGADCLKVQTYTADTITMKSDKDYFKIEGGLWDGYTLYDLYKEAAMPWEWQKNVKERCDEIGLDFLSTPFDSTSVDFLEGIDIEMYKIASFELIDIPLIRYVAKKGKPMIVSCGMGTVDEIEDAIEAMLDEGMKKEDIVLLKCTSEYPATLSDMNLMTIRDMKERFGVNIGLSDHSIGSLAPVVAVAMGATVVEKHFTLSRDIKNPDSDFSSNPQEFKKMTEDIQDAYDAKGQIRYEACGIESANVSFRKSVFAYKDIKEGEEFTEDNTKVIRPGHGLKPKYYFDILGKPSKKSYEAGEPIGEGELR